MNDISETADSTITLIPAFIQSTSEVFQTMVFMPVTPDQPTKKTKGCPSGYISGTISLTGEEISGNVSLILEMPLATKIFRSMMGLDGNAPVNAQEINDVVGELANMVAGGAKSKLQEQNVHFKIGLPTVVVGENHYIEPPRNVSTIVVPFAIQEGKFHLELSC
jgi:chemotaxis protein CheX